MSNKTRMAHRRERRRMWAKIVTCAVAALAMVAATTIVCARVAVLTGMEHEVSEEYRMYLDGQKETVPQTWDELQAAMDEDDEAPFESERIEAALIWQGTKIEDVTVSHYCICKRCCGKDESHPAYGITASGRAAAPGTSVAVDPNMIPLGSDVLVDYGDGEIHYYRADDTCGAIKGARIDLCVEDHDTALALGLRKATVWYIEGEDND